MTDYPQKWYDIVDGRADMLDELVPLIRADWQHRIADAIEGDDWGYEALHFAGVARGFGDTS